MRRGRCATLLGAVLLASLAGGPALAHKTNLTKGSVTITAVGAADTSVDYRLTVSAHDLAVALGIETDLTTPVPQAAFEAREAILADYLARGLLLSVKGERCTPGTPDVDYGRLPDDVVLALRFVCPAPITRLRIDYRLFFEIDPAHRSIGSLTAPDGTVEEFLFDRSLTSFEAAIGAPAAAQAPPPQWHERFVSLLLLGVEHILLGYDHLLFLLALLIVGGGFARLVGVVSAFTISHSLTLALAWFGLITLPGRLVETLIALSIVVVALENLLGWGARRRWLVAGGFGLVHGLGFYSALKDLSLGGSDLITTLLAFNLGVEAGQIGIVALVFLPLAWWLRRSWYASTARLASLAILLVAAWWTLERAALL